MNSTRLWPAALCCGALLAACGSTSISAAHPDTNLGITASLHVSGTWSCTITT